MRKLMRVAVIFCAGLGILAQMKAQDIPAETIQLSRIRDHMIAQLRRQPNYTCVETVERSARQDGRKSFQLKDTLRLEVALVDGKEMFAWPGSRKFEATDLRDMVKEGVTGNGNFALFARAIFEARSATFDYKGPEGGLVRYDYHVPLLQSGYNIRIGDKHAVVPYKGSIFADSKTLDVHRIDVVANDIPLMLGLAEADTRMDYARVKIGENDFLLPAESELTMVDADGHEHRNHVRLASCREFTGESVLTFDDAPKDSAAPAKVEEIALPADMLMDLRLEDEIDTGTAAVGDPVRARLASDVKIKGRVLIAKGAMVTGRVTRLEKHNDYNELGLEFDEAEGSGVHAHFEGKLDSLPQTWFLAPAMTQRRTPVRRAGAGESILILKSGRVRVIRGTAMFWRTVL
jgi:hypothetical protein